MGPIDLLFGFQGRAGRGQFWLALLICMAVFIVATMLGVLVTSSLDAWFSAVLILYVLTLILLVPVGVKRLHDRNKRGWWLLLFLGGPSAILLVGLLIGGDDSTPELPAAIGVVQYIGLAISLWALIELGFLRGTIGRNPYGRDPVAPKPAKH
jgi:uncharacterized membrane protein YhaH (DUF805 family)